MSEKATRDSFGEGLRDLGGEMPNLVVLDAELNSCAKSNLFARAYPDRFFQMGLSEANMVGTAAGLSFTGLVPFACGYGAFLAGRYETIRVSVGYSQANVKLVGTHAGIGVGEDGYSQMGLEDIAVLRSLPGLTILQPSDDITTRAALRFAATTAGPVYLRLTRHPAPALYRSEGVFQCGRGIFLKEGKDLALIASGATVSEALKASEELSDFNPWVIDMHTIKPIDKALVKTLAHTCRAIVSVEDHSTVGGLGSAVAEVLAEEGFSGTLVRLGVQEKYGESGSPAELYEKFGISAARIATRAREAMKRRR